MQASQTTAQGLWIGSGIGILMGTAIWFLGPPAMQGKAHIPYLADLIYQAGCVCLAFSIFNRGTLATANMQQTKSSSIFSGYLTCSAIAAYAVSVQIDSVHSQDQCN